MLIQEKWPRVYSKGQIEAHKENMSQHEVTLRAMLRALQEDGYFRALSPAFDVDGHSLEEIFSIEPEIGKICITELTYGPGRHTLALQDMGVSAKVTISVPQYHVMASWEIWRMAAALDWPGTRREKPKRSWGTYATTVNQTYLFGYHGDSMVVLRRNARASSLFGDIIVPK